MKNNNLNSIIFGTIFGLLAGTVGALSINLDSIGSFSNLNFNRELNLSNYGYLSPNLVIRDPKKVVVNQDVKVDETIRDIQSALLSIFVKTNKQDTYYELNKPYAQAIAATSDGWIMALWPEVSTAAALNKNISNYVVVDSQKNIYSIDKVLVGTDDISGLVFFHLKDVNYLSVKRLLPESEIKLGQSLILATADQKYILDSLAKKSVASYYLNSDQYSQEVALAYNQKNSPVFVFNLSGDMLGLRDNSDRWILSPVIDAYWRSLLRNNTMQRASLGVNYLDLSLVVSSNDNSLNKGALIESINGDPILKDSAAEDAGLKEGDIITRLNGVEINKENNLSLLLLTYNPGDQVMIDYLRNGESMEAEITLGTN